MKKWFVITAALCSALVGFDASAGNGPPINTGSANGLTLAVFGDWPYSQALLDAAPLLLDSINSEPHVRLVMHVGDIHSGSMQCTSDWNQGIFDLFQQFQGSLCLHARRQREDRLPPAGGGQPEPADRTGERAQPLLPRPAQHPRRAQAARAEPRRR